MNRVLPEQVVEAYKVTGLIPIRCAWVNKDRRGACALSTVACHRRMHRARLLLQLGEEYEMGFTGAWDEDSPGDVPSERLKPRYRLGWFDGVSARKALNAEFGSDPIPVEKGAVKGDA